MNTIHVGSTHLTWGSVAEDAVWQTFLKDVSDLGYHGISVIEFMMGERYKNPRKVRAEADAHGLAVCGLDLKIEQPDEYYRQGCSFLHTVGGNVVVLLGGHGKKDEDFRRVADDLNRIGRICTTEGVLAVYHHHTGNTAETFEEFKKLMDLVDPKIFHVMVDTGHITKDMKPHKAGRVIRHFDKRLKFLELKDWSTETDLTTEVGEGLCDYPDAWQALKDIGYSGWVVVEQNWAKKNRTPRESARISRECIRKGLGV
ncbi:MAG: TIM barrel protein [Planctomycetes bacterium]|nr:TIM barrel protein [Planctomycetota bacterium]